MTRIAIYKNSDFTSKGKLKKRARAEYITEIEKYDAGKMADYIKYLGYKDFSTPYFFTHIEATSPYNHGERVKIFQDVLVGSNWLITSPQSLITHLA